MENKAIERFVRFIHAAERGLVFSMAAGSLLCALYSMVTRYIVPQLAFDWVDELMIYFTVWAIWIAGGRILLSSSHVNSDVLALVVGDPWTEHMRRFGDIVAAVFCLIVAWGGIQVVILAISLGERSESGLNAPLWIYYLSMPVGLLMAALRYFLLGFGRVEDGNSDD